MVTDRRCEMVTKRWQDQVNAMLGLWLVVSPWVLDYTGTRLMTVGMPNVAVWTALVFGVAAVVLSFMDIYAHKVWEMALDVVVGLGLMLAPWVLGFAAQTVPATNDMLVGLVLAAVAIWSLLSEPEVQQWLQAHHRMRTR